MEAPAPAPAGLKRVSEEPQGGEQPALKRKKTVVWADGAGLALASELAAAAAEGRGAAGKGITGSSAGKRAAPPQPPVVVVLPADELYSKLDDEQLLGEQAETPGAAEGPLPRVAVLRRRLDGVERLAGLYEQQLWALLDELRLRHAQFLRQPGMAVLLAEQQQQEQQEQQEQQSSQGQPGSMQELWLRHRAATRQEQDGDDDEQQQQPSLAAAVQQEQQQAAAAQQQGSEDAAAAAAEAPQSRDAPAPLPAARLAPEAAELPLFEELEGLLLQLRPEEASAPPELGGEPALEASLRQQKAAFARSLALAGALERGCLASLARELDHHGAMAALVGRGNRWLLRQGVVVLGRSTESKGSVDIDLSLEGQAQHVSRQQARLAVGADGRWAVRCLGRRAMQVNGRMVAEGQDAALPHLSLIRVGAVALLFALNSRASVRLATRSAALTA